MGNLLEALRHAITRQKRILRAIMPSPQAADEGRTVFGKLDAAVYCLLGKQDCQGIGGQSHRGAE